MANAIYQDQFSSETTVRGSIHAVVLGIVGAAVASAILSFFGVQLGGWIGYLVAGFIGAALLIWIVRAVRGRPA